MKDKTVSFLLEKFINIKIKRYGKMLDLRIDSEKKSIYLSVHLKGETAPINILADNYSFTKEGEEEFLMVEDIKISREWLNLLAVDILKEKKIKLPQGIALTALKVVL